MSDLQHQTQAQADKCLPVDESAPPVYLAIACIAVLLLRLWYTGDYPGFYSGIGILF
ncbi:MAG: hypothetical protein ACQESR_26105 [Planctomycetota bacterium]